MATSFKTLLPNDIQSSRTKLHESIPLTGTIISGTYSDNNIKNYSHGMFQSIYDYPYLSSSANHIFDMTAGFSSNSGLSGSTGVTQNDPKIDIYNEMAQMLAGYSSSGSIHPFDHSGSFGSNAAATTMKDVIVFNFARLLTKDQIQVSSNGFQMKFGVGAAYSTPFSDTVIVQDNNGTNAYTNSPAGEFNTLFATNAGVVTNEACGLVFYDAGVAILTASLFSSTFNGATDCIMDDGGLDMEELLVSGSISSSCDAIRRRIDNISFNNTTELNSTIYFCRSSFNEFNYSSNPTYVTGSKLRVKSVATDDPVSYITTVGLYSPDNELLAVGKVSEPLKKTPSNEYTLRVRLDY